jgi:hypothetical protein
MKNYDEYFFQCKCGDSYNLFVMLLFRSVSYIIETLKGGGKIKLEEAKKKRKKNKNKTKFYLYI